MSEPCESIVQYFVEADTLVDVHIQERVLRSSQRFNPINLESLLYGVEGYDRNGILKAKEPWLLITNGVIKELQDANQCSFFDKHEGGAISDLRLEVLKVLLILCSKTRNLDLRLQREDDLTFLQSRGG